MVEHLFHQTLLAMMPYWGSKRAPSADLPLNWVPHSQMQPSVVRRARRRIYLRHLTRSALVASTQHRRYREGDTRAFPIYNTS
jgi:hypothetical protein